MTEIKKLQRPYHGYYAARDIAENAFLTHVGRGTPAGEYMRRFWQPVALSSELADLPLAVRMLGEDLVLFRTTRDEIGLLARHCSHRGSSLEFGVTSDSGIRCCYHGWHFAVDGTILETPNDPQSKIRGRFCHPAYPTHEFAGIIFAYMGPPDEKPEFPHFDTLDEPGNELVPFSLRYACNWLQVLENTQDPVHSVFLHTRISGTQFAESWGALPNVQYVETPIGMMNINVRRWKGNVWVRTTETILPNMNQAGALWETAEGPKSFVRVSLTRWMRPIDDTSTAIIGWRHFNDRADPDGHGDKSEVGKEKIDFVGQTEDRPHEEQQRIPGDYEAIVSQRPIAIHDLETLCATDRGVAMLRRSLRREFAAFEKGEPNAASEKRISGYTPTYTQDTIFAMPPAEDDEALLAEMGRKVAQILFDTAHEPVDNRRDAIEKRVRALL